MHAKWSTPFSRFLVSLPHPPIAFSLQRRRPQRSPWPPRIILENEDAEIDPVRTGEGGGRGEAKTDRLSAIIEEFNDLFGGIECGDGDRVIRTVTVDIPTAVAKDAKFENARQNSDSENARVEADKATERAVLGMVQDNTQLFKLFADNPDFRRWLTDTAFRLAYEAAS